MDKIFKFFVSSTYTDLSDIRTQAMQGVLKAGHFPVMMEGFSATATQKEKIKQEIDDCDAYILIVGSKYGTIDVETGLSYTEWEYDYAAKHGLPILTMILSEEYIRRRMTDGTLKPSDLEINSEKYKDFVQKASSRQADFITSISQVKSLTEAGVMQIVKDYGDSMTGLISGTVLEDLRMTEDELKTLRQTRNQLQVKLTNAQKKVVEDQNFPTNKEFDSLFSKIYESRDSDALIESSIEFIKEFVQKKVDILNSKLTNPRGNISIGYSEEQKNEVLFNIVPDYIGYIANYENRTIEVMVKIDNPWSYEQVDLLQIKGKTLYSEGLNKELSVDYLNDTLQMYTNKKQVN